MEFGGKDDRVSAMRMKRRDSMAAVKEKGSENVNDAANTWASQVAVNKLFVAWYQYACPKRHLGPLLRMMNRKPHLRTEEQVDTIYAALQRVKWVRELGSKRGRVVARVGRILYLGPQSQIYEEGSPVKYDGDWVYAVIYGLVEMHKAIANQKGSWSRREGSTLLGHILPGSHFGDLNVAAKQELRPYTALVSPEGPAWLLVCRANEYLPSLQAIESVELRASCDLACRLAVFRLISIRELLSLAEQMEVCTLPKGATVVSQGDDPYYVYFVIEGEVELVRDIGGEARDGLRHLDGQAYCSDPPRETLHARLGLCSRGDVFGEDAVMDQTLQPYTARCTKATTYLACPWSFLLAKLDGYTLRGFNSCRRKYPTDRELRAMHRDALAVSHQVGARPVDVVTSHLRPRKHLEFLQKAFPGSIQHFQGATNEQIQAYYLQTQGDPAWESAAPRRRRPERTAARAADSSAELDLSTIGGPRLGVLAAAKAVKSKWNAKDTLTHYIKELPQYYAQRAVDERRMVHTTKLLDVTATTQPAESREYVELLEAACVLVLRLADDDSGEALDSHILSCVVQKWTAFFEDRARANTFQFIRWSSDTFAVLKAANNGQELAETVTSVVGVSLQLEQMLRQQLHVLASQHVSAGGPGVPAVRMTAGLAHGAVFVTYSRLGHFVVHLKGACWDAAMALSQTLAHGVFVTDGVRDVASDTHRFDSHAGAYRLTAAVVFPYRQSHAAIFGRDWRQNQNLTVSPRMSRADPSKFIDQPTSTSVPSAVALTMSVNAHVQAFRVPSKIPSAKLGSHSPIPYPSSDAPLRREKSDSTIRLPSIHSSPRPKPPASNVSSHRLRKLNPHVGNRLRQSYPQPASPVPLCGINLRSKARSPLPAPSTRSPVTDGANSPLGTKSSNGAATAVNVRADFRPGKHLEPIASARSPTRQERLERSEQAHQRQLGGPSSVDSKWRLLPPRAGYAEQLDEKPVESRSRAKPAPRIAHAPQVAVTTGNTMAAAQYIDSLPVDTPTLNLSTSALSRMPDVARFTKLEGLAMGYNLLTTCPAIFTLLQLRRLDLCANQLTAIPTQLSALTSLQHLNLANNRIVTLPRSIAALSQLRTLSVHGNTQLQELPHDIGSLTRLEQLDASGCALVTLPASIGGLEELHTLRAANNRLGDLPHSISQLSQLRDVDLSVNRLVGVASTHQLFRLPALETLRLSDNAITALPESALDWHSGLQVLSLGHNQITVVPDDVGVLTRLRDLDLSHNALVDLPESLGALVSLTSLNVRANRLRLLPELMAQLTRLQRLVLSENLLQGLPANLGEGMAELRHFAVDCNRLESLPHGIVQCTRLQTLVVLTNPYMRVPPPAVAARGKEAIMQFMRSYKAPKLHTVARLTTMFAVEQGHEQRMRVFSDSESDCATSVSSDDDTVDDETDHEGEDDPRLAVSLTPRVSVVAQQPCSRTPGA